MSLKYLFIHYCLSCDTTKRLSHTLFHSVNVNTAYNRIENLDMY